MPIDQKIRGLVLEIDASTNPEPEAQPLLEYRFIDSTNTQTILARIKGTLRPHGGGELVFETDAGADTTTQRMLIDNNGNVGIGTGNPGARLHVVGDAKFGGPLSVEGAFTANGVAKIGGDLSVTGKVSAASFAGDGAGLSNITAADDSITSAKLAKDADSLRKVTGGKMVISSDNVGIGTANPGVKLDVAGNGKFDGQLDVEGAVTVNAGAKIGGDLSVTGKVSAARFAGDGAGLSNITAADDSITSAKLAQDADSLRKVTGGKININGNNVSIAAVGTVSIAAAGGVKIAGRLTASQKTFKIDHPLDPENEYLSHTSVESPDVMNIYNGNTTTDNQGNATVMLPDYFEALNSDFRYQLTVIGKLAQAAVASEIENNRFAIRTNEPNVKVSWQVTGIRHDPSANANRVPVEEEKPQAERGLFLYPEDYGQPNTKGIGFVRHPEQMLGEAKSVST